MTSSNSGRPQQLQQSRRVAAAAAAHNMMQRVVLGSALLLLGLVGVGVVDGFKYKVSSMRGALIVCGVMPTYRHTKYNTSI